jgi:hypothetical protein
MGEIYIHWLWLRYFTKIQMNHSDASLETGGMKCGHMQERSQEFLMGGGQNWPESSLVQGVASLRNVIFPLMRGSTPPSLAMSLAVWIHRCA